MDLDPKLTELVKNLKRIDCKNQYIKSILKTESDGPYFITLVDKIEDITCKEDLEDSTDLDFRHSFLLTGKNIKFKDGFLEIENYNRRRFCPVIHFWDFVIMDNKEEIERQILAEAIDENYKTLL